MIYITADTHGKFRRITDFLASGRATKDDVLIILGDAGFNYDTYREVEWHGGTVWQEEKYPNLLFAKDGEVYDFDGRKLLVCGGAYTVFKEYRIAKGLPWYSDEQPSPAIRQRVEQQLERRNWQADIILTHTCPSKLVPKEKYIPGVDQSTVDTGTEDWLDAVEDRLTYRNWYCGHWHIDKQIGPFRFVYKDIIQI